MTTKLNSMSLFVPIQRCDSKEQIVEGYCFVNEEVGDGYRLTRRAMEAAADDYMKFGAVREMHGRSAAGTALGLRWDDHGCYLQARIVDDLAWKKVEQGVYKGFSVGVRPKAVRGKDVISCEWPEVSLVDRPKDWDAVFSLVRAGDLPDECEVDVVEDSVDRLELLEQEIGELRSALRSAAEREADLMRRLSAAASIERSDRDRPYRMQVAAVQRSFGSANSSANSDREDLKTEFETLLRADWAAKTDAEKAEAIRRVGELKRSLGIQ